MRWIFSIMLLLMATLWIGVGSWGWAQNPTAPFIFHIECCIFIGGGIVFMWFGIKALKEF